MFKSAFFRTDYIQICNFFVQNIINTAFFLVEHFQNLQIFFESIHAGMKNVEKTEAHQVYVTDYNLKVPKSTRFVSIILKNVTGRHFTVCELDVYGGIIVYLFMFL